jgi:hypothetical protein
MTRDGGLKVFSISVLIQYTRLTVITLAQTVFDHNKISIYQIPFYLMGLAKNALKSIIIILLITLYVITLSSAYCMIKITLLFVKRDDTLLVHTYLKTEMRIDLKCVLIQKCLMI